MVELPRQRLLIIPTESSVIQVGMFISLNIVTTACEKSTHQQGLSLPMLGPEVLDLVGTPVQQLVLPYMVLLG